MNYQESEVGLASEQVITSTLQDAPSESDLAQDPQNQDTNESWLSMLPETMRTNSGLSKFKDVPSLAHSYLELEKSYGKRVSQPKNDASDEEWNKFYSKLGLPEDKKYLDERNPEDEEYLKAYEEMFYDSGISSKQGKKLLNAIYKFSSDLQQKQEAKQVSMRESNINWLQSNYGSAFDNKMTLMQAALSNFGTKELAEFIEEANYSPPLVDLLVQVGETLKPDSLVMGSKARVALTPDKALDEIKRLESDQNFMVQFKDRNNQGHVGAVAKMEELYKSAYPKPHF